MQLASYHGTRAGILGPGQPAYPPSLAGQREPLRNRVPAGRWRGRAHAGSSTIADLLTITSSGDVAAAAGNLSVSTVGKGLAVKEGSNAKQGAVTLVAGTVTVANTSVTASSRIFLTSNSGGSGTPGWVRESARVAGVSFTLTSSSVTDGSIVVYEIFEPA